MATKPKKLRWYLALTASSPFLISAMFLPAYSARTQDAAVGFARTNASSKGPVDEKSMPFRIGETLNYHVTWAGFSSAAAVELSVPEHRRILGWSTWHFRASAHTLRPFRSFLPVDDQIDSDADATTLESRQYETHLNEMGSVENQILHPSPIGQPHRAGIPVVEVLPGTLDPLGVLFVLRTVDWRQTAEFRAPVYDGEDLLEVRARREVSNETIAVDAGNFSAARISIHLYKSGVEAPQESFTMWLANDVPRTPVLLQAELPLGSVRVELTFDWR